MTVPQTSVLDNFNRANENPLSGGGNWARPTAVDPQNLVLTSNAVGFAGNDGAAWWTPSTFGPDCEVYCTMTAWDAISNQQDIHLLLCMDVAGNGNPRYDADFNIRSDGSVNVVRLQRGGSQAWLTGQLSLSTPANFALGGKLLFRKVGDVLEVWLKPSGGAWGRQIALNDIRELGAISALPAGRIGVQMASQPGQASAIKFDDFGGGTVTGSPSGIAELGASGRHDLVAVSGSSRIPAPVGKASSLRTQLSRRVWNMPPRGRPGAGQTWPPPN